MSACRSLHDDDRRWHVTAHDARPRDRLARHDALGAVGATEIEALERLRAMLDERAGE
jgi:hypothetical protein